MTKKLATLQPCDCGNKQESLAGTIAKTDKTVISRDKPESNPTIKTTNKTSDKPEIDVVSDEIIRLVADSVNEVQMLVSNHRLLSHVFYCACGSEDDYHQRLETMLELFISRFDNFAETTQLNLERIRLLVTDTK
jgi:hypothetical protein